MILGYADFAGERPTAVATGQETLAYAIERITTTGMGLIHRPELNDSQRRAVWMVMFQALHELSPTARLDSTGHSKRPSLLVLIGNHWPRAKQGSHADLGRKKNPARRRGLQNILLGQCAYFRFTNRRYLDSSSENKPFVSSLHDSSSSTGGSPASMLSMSISSTATVPST